MELRKLWQSWGPQGLFDNWAVHGMTSQMAYMIPHTLVPILRLVSGDPEGTDRGYAAVVAQREPSGPLDSPSVRSVREYGRFVRELEWVSQGLKKHLSQQEYEAFVSGTVARAIEDWIGAIKPKFAELFLDESGTERLEPSERAKVLSAKITKFVSDHLFAHFNALNFMVGPMEVRQMDIEGGYMEAYIPACALHTALGQVPVEEACVVGCKGGTEAAFGEGSPIRVELEPHLPGLDCTMRAHWDPAALRRGDVPSAPAPFVPESALLRKSGRDAAIAN